MLPAGTQVAPDFTLADTFFGGPLLRSYNLNLNIDGFAKLSGNNELTAGFARRENSKLINIEILIIWKN